VPLTPAVGGRTERAAHASNSVTKFSYAFHVFRERIGDTAITITTVAETVETKKHDFEASLPFTQGGAPA
jgi:hypothetical protein